MKINAKISLLPIIWIVFLLSNVYLASCTYRRVAFGPCDQRVKTAECWRVLAQDADIMNTSYLAADKLLENLNVAQFDQPVTLGKQARLWVATIAEVDHLKESSPLGRLIGEQLAARFTQQGYTVIDAKLQKELTLISSQGEFILSRDWPENDQLQPADVVVAGTYAVAKDLVYITLKLFDLRSYQAVSSFAYTLPLGANTSALLQTHSWWDH